MISPPKHCSGSNVALVARPTIHRRSCIMRTAKQLIVAAIVLAALVGTAALMEKVTTRPVVAEEIGQGDHWRHHDGRWSMWNEADKRWYYTDGNHWYFHDG